MTNWFIIGGLALLAVVALVLIFVTVQNSLLHKKHAKTVSGAPKELPADLSAATEQQAGAIFDETFREELRNRGRLHFEKIIGENAMFLQQDLRLTTSQLNEYMKNEITRKLQEEFAKYEESIMDAKQLAVDSIAKTNAVIEEQRKTLSQELQKQVAAEKAHLLTRFEGDMARVVNHYVIAAIGNQIDMSDQLEYILAELEANKKQIMQDITNNG